MLCTNWETRGACSFVQIQPPLRSGIIGSNDRVTQTITPIPDSPVSESDLRDKAKNKIIGAKEKKQNHRGKGKNKIIGAKEGTRSSGQRKEQDHRGKGKNTFRLLVLWVYSNVVSTGPEIVCSKMHIEEKIHIEEKNTY